MVCGMHTTLLTSGTSLQEGGGTNTLLPTHSFPFLSPSPSSFPLLLPFLHSSLPWSSWHDVRWWALFSGDMAQAVVIGSGWHGGCHLPTSLNKGRGSSNDVADVGTVEMWWRGDGRQWWCGMVGGHQPWQWACPCLAHAGACEGDSRGGSEGTCGVVVVRVGGVMGQCLATGGCQTLQLLLICILIISKHYKAHPVSCTKFKIQMVGTACTNTFSDLLFLQ